MKGKHAVILIFLLGLLPLAGCAKQPVLLEVPDAEAITETPIQLTTIQPVVTTTLENTEQPPPQTVTEPDLQTEIPVSQNEEQQESQQSSTVLSQTERWYAGTLEYRGVSIAVNGFVQPDFPTPMKQIRLAGAGLGKKTILNALQTYFDLHPSFALQGAEEYYVNFTALDSDGDRSTTTNQDSLEFDASFRTDDPVIGLYDEKCMECLRGLGIQGMRNVGLAAYFDRRQIIPPEAFVQGSKQTLHIVIPYVIDGLSTEYQNMIVSRSLIEDSDSAARHIMDYPFAGFTFDSQFRLIGMSMSFYQVDAEKTIQGQPISWQQAVTAALDYEISDRYHMGRDELTADEYFDVFFQTYTVRVIRVFPMWMPGWMNGYLPGWCVQLQLYDKQTGEFRMNYALAVSAQTGEVIQNRHRED